MKIPTNKLLASYDDASLPSISRKAPVVSAEHHLSTRRIGYLYKQVGGGAIVTTQPSAAIILPTNLQKRAIKLSAAAPRGCILIGRLFRRGHADGWLAKELLGRHLRVSCVSHVSVV